MTRNTDLKSILFPVTLRDVFVEVPVETNLFGETTYQKNRAPRHKAVVNENNNHVFSIVTDQYKLISNQEAFEIAMRIFNQLFNTVNPSEMEVFNIFTSSKFSYCHIDIIHKTYSINIYDNEVYIPFIRATNSYNRNNKLGFDVGFVRLLCNNGMIFEEETIKLRYSHMKHVLNDQEDIILEANKLKHLEVQFKTYLDKIKEKEVSRDEALITMQTVLNLKFDTQNANSKIANKNRERLREFTGDFDTIYKKYKDEFGESAYTLFNTITEYCSQARRGIINTNQIDAMQKRAGEWLKTA